MFFCSLYAAQFSLGNLLGLEINYYVYKLQSFFIICLVCPSSHNNLNNLRWARTHYRHTYLVS